MIVKTPKSKRTRVSIIYMTNREHEIFARDWEKIKQTLYESNLKGELKELDGKWRLEIRSSPRNQSEGTTRKILGDRQFLIYCLRRFEKSFKEEYKSQFELGELTFK